MTSPRLERNVVAALKSRQIEDVVGIWVPKQSLLRHLYAFEIGIPRGASRVAPRMLRDATKPTREFAEDVENALDSLELGGTLIRRQLHESGTVLFALVADAEKVGELTVSDADRIIRLNHNQRQDLDDQVGEIIDLIERENSIGNIENLREMLLGHLNAGRELIRAGIFSARTFYMTMIVGLKMLIEKHGGTAAAIAAAKLLDLLLRQYGIG